jgi:heme O synthase-like polyprenyltransferase
MLPVVYPDGRRTFRQIISFSLALLPISLLPLYLAMAGMVGLGLGMLWIRL